MTEPGITLGLIVGLCLSTLLLIYRSFFMIDQGHLGLLLTFGRAELSDPKRRILKTWGPGLHFKWPWQKLQTVSIMEQSLDLSGKEGGINAMASDGTILRLDSKLRYTPIPNELYAYLFEMRNPIPHIKGLFTCLLRNEIANFKSTALEVEQSQTGSYSVIRRERKLLNQHLENFARQKIGGRYGVRFDAVDLTDILPPDELAQALNAVFNAQTEANTMYARAEGECQSRILSSKRGVTIAAETAKAVETEILTLARFLAELKERKMLKPYIERRRAETTYESRTVFVRRSS